MRLHRVVLITVVVATLASCATRAVAATPPANLPHPDMRVITTELPFMSSQYLMRYSGFDGPPGDMNPADGNLPPQVNGWQEFFAHWKQRIANKTYMGPTFSRAINVADHLFQPAVFVGGANTPYRGDVAVATIPGQSCPGETTLVAAHPDSTPGLNSGNGSTYDDTSGVTMGMAELSGLTKWWDANNAWPARTIKVALFDAEEIGLEGSQYYAANLISPGPQGKYVLVANMDQNGMEYPAYPQGTTTSTWTPGPWYTNINASPIKDFSIYGPNAKTPPPAIAKNLPAILRFRNALAAEVARAFNDLGLKYHFKLQLDNPLENGATVAAYKPSDVARYSPVQDDTLGRTDQVPFVAQGIPGFGVLGAYDSNSKEDIVGNTPLSPLGDQGLISQQAGYDTPRDNLAHLNAMADGNPNPSAITTGLYRALELPATWTDYLLSRPEYTGKVARTSAPIAYYETSPRNPKAGEQVAFDASASASRVGANLHYFWSFGDGAAATAAKPHHAYAHSGYYSAALAVRDAAGHVTAYQTTITVGQPSGSAPTGNTCGRVSSTTAARVVRGAARQ
jgi:Zn-dependent M28 family amino/carboxypeptidase